jgi:CCR4-NOT transcriptional regulation complex NOT5 subunit
MTATTYVTLCHVQAYAAQELYNREWRFHTELKLWVKRASPADAITQVHTLSTLSR